MGIGIKLESIAQVVDRNLHLDGGRRRSTGMYIWCIAVEMDALRQLLLPLLLLIDRPGQQ